MTLQKINTKTQLLNEVDWTIPRSACFLELFEFIVESLDIFYRNGMIVIQVERHNTYKNQC